MSDKLQIGIGEWKMRNGKKAIVAAHRPGTQFCWIGWVDWHQYCWSWKDGGQDRSEGKSDYDIISPWTSPIATGHNPDKLTEEQVGNGFRAPDWDELEKLSVEKKQKALEYWQSSLKAWIKPDCCGCCMTGTYRTRLSREELAALDKPKMRRIRVEELPAVCWVTDGSGHSLITGRNEYYVWSHQGVKHSIEEMAQLGLKWSSDLKNWNSFEVEDKQ